MDNEVNEIEYLTEEITKKKEKLNYFTEKTKQTTNEIDDMIDETNKEKQSIKLLYYQINKKVNEIKFLNDEINKKEKNIDMLITKTNEKRNNINMFITETHRIKGEISFLTDRINIKKELNFSSEMTKKMTDTLNILIEINNLERDERSRIFRQIIEIDNPNNQDIIMDFKEYSTQDLQEFINSLEKNDYLEENISENEGEISYYTQNETDNYREDSDEDNYREDSDEDNYRHW